MKNMKRLIFNVIIVAFLIGCNKEKLSLEDVLFETDNDTYWACVYKGSISSSIPPPFDGVTYRFATNTRDGSKYGQAWNTKMYSKGCGLDISYSFRLYNYNNKQININRPEYIGDIARYCTNDDFWSKIPNDEIWTYEKIFLEEIKIEYDYP